MMSCHSITHISMSACISYIAVSLILGILPKVEGLLHILIISSVLTQGDDFKLVSMTNVMISTFQLSTSHFSSITLLCRMGFAYLKYNIPLVHVQIIRTSLTVGAPKIKLP